MSQTVSKYSDAELQEFKALIEQKIEKTEEQIKLLQSQIVETTENLGEEFGGDWVDDSSTNSEVEMLNNMAIRQRKYLQDLKNAMIRIRNKTYGVCMITGELIDKKRLKAVPTTTKSVAAKMHNKVSSSKRQAGGFDAKRNTSKSKEKKVITRIIRKSNTIKPNSSKIFEEEDEFPLAEDEILKENPEIDKSFTDFDELPDNND